MKVESSDMRQTKASITKRVVRLLEFKLSLWVASKTRKTAFLFLKELLD